MVYIIIVEKFFFVSGYCRCHEDVHYIKYSKSALDFCQSTYIKKCQWQKSREDINYVRASTRACNLDWTALMHGRDGNCHLQIMGIFVKMKEGLCCEYYK